MKVAILLSGQPRFLDGEGYQSIKEKILDAYDCDVFCHYWWSEDGLYQTSPWSGLGTMLISGNIPDQIQELYHPKRLKYEAPLNEESNLVRKGYTRTTHISTNYNLPSMYYSMKESFKLMREHIQETGTVYDWVIRLRYDAILTAFPNLNNLTPNRLYAPDYSQFHRLVGNNGLIMSESIAKEIMCVYDYMDMLYSKGVIFNDENIITALIRFHNISLCILPKTEFYIDLCRK